ncbi:hypothetical protein D3C84_825790 [compost metagenome]
MHDADQALRRLDLDHKRQVLKNARVAALLNAGEPVEPISTVDEVHAAFIADAASGVRVDGHLLMITAHCMKPRLA